MGVWKVVGDTLFHFGDQTSIAGLNNVCHRKSFGKKVYWSFLFAVFLAATIYSVFDNIKTYLDYGIVTSTDLSHKTSVIFPAVSICNVNRVHCTNLFEETVVQQERLERLLKNETENATLGDIETTNRTFAVLDKLFVTSGCKQQICDQCSVTEVVPMEFVKSTFYCLQARAEINCIDTPQQVSPKECFWLLMMAENGTNLDFLKHFDMVIEDLQEINEAIDKYKCKDPNKLKDVCQVQLQAPASGQSQVGKDQQQGQFIKLNICPSIPNPPGPPAKGQVTTQRKKRQIAPNPPGSGPSGSGPSGPLGPRPGTDEDFEKNAEFLKLFMTLDPITRARIGHRIGSRESTLLQKNISSFITRCSYKGGTCDGDEFWFPFSTAEFGNCFTFNYDRNYADRRRYRKTTLTGTSYGLSVEIFLDQTNYMLNKLSKKAGARIVIHDPANPPLPDEYGMDLRPNTASSIAVQLTNITRLEAPFISNCTLGWNQTGYDNINTTIRYTLAVSLPFSFCLHLTCNFGFHRVVSGTVYKKASWMNVNVFIRTLSSPRLIRMTLGLSHHA